MTSRLWYMNADFETELSAGGSVYRRPHFFAALNARLAPQFLWLASPGDSLLLDEPWPDSLARDSERRGVELLLRQDSTRKQFDKMFTPWGWTQSVLALGETVGAQVSTVSPETIRRVNSKLWSHALEEELGVALKGAACASQFAELQQAVSRACPHVDDKWVIKSPFGFAARERVLGRGPRLEGAQATWAKRQFMKGGSLIFQPWLERVREYGVTFEIKPDGEIEIFGVSDLQTNGAGTGTGYLLGRKIDAGRLIELEEIARIVGARLFQEGYVGPAGVDAVEHTRGLHPLLEVNARYTMGFIALAVERLLRPQAPMLWKLEAGFGK